MSIVTGLFMVNWLIEGQFTIKLQRLKERKSVLLIISVFFVYLLGLFWTDNILSGLKDVKIQLPLLIIPIVIGTSAELNYRQVKKIIYFFSAAVVLASLCSIWVLMGLSAKTIQDPRDMSLFISHIRFALLINISIFSMGWYLIRSEQKRIAEKALLIIAMIWLSLFLVILKSVTGWVVFMTILTVVVIVGILQIKKLVWRLALLGILFSMFLLPPTYILFVIHQFYDVERIPENIQLIRTKKGNPYSHDFNNKQLENGHYTFYFINENELREAWDKRSKISYDSTSVSGFDRYVLFRYMTSKGLRKDAEGLKSLTATDIRNIEKGLTNYRFVNPLSFYNRIYQIVWEVDIYRKGGNPSGHSVTQRIEYYKMAWKIIEENFWMGTGTGGYVKAYQKKYDQNKFFQEQQFRQRSHNMFLSYWIDFGLIGLIYVCFALFAPVFIERKTKSFLLMIFLLIVLLSFMNEDSLNNHDAISFFAYLYPLFLYSKYENPIASNQPEADRFHGKGMVFEN